MPDASSPTRPPPVRARPPGPAPALPEAPATLPLSASMEDQLLGLQALEQSLLRMRQARTSWLPADQYPLLRYALRLAALERFTVAGRDITVDDSLVQPFRDFLIPALAAALRRQAAPRGLLPRIAVEAQALRAGLLMRHVADFGAAELDAEIRHKKLVLIAGGGGGAGYVYIGALARLMVEGVAPDYIVGSSIGALLGAFIARHRRPDYEGLLGTARNLAFGDVFGTPRASGRYSVPGLMRLHLRGLSAEFTRADGEPLRLSDLEIPYEAVVGGVRSRIHDRAPALLRAPRPTGRRRPGSPAERAWQLTTLLTPNLIDEVVLGRDELTRDFDVIEAVGFSAAIPGVLQYDPWRRSERMHGLLGELCRQRRLAAIVDGGVANNVPAKVAWRGVRGGRIGSRNAYYLAFDSFAPQTHRKHILLWPVTQAVQLQMPANRPYFDWLLQFRPTLSPANLLPSPADLDRAWAWGWQQMDAIAPMVLAALEPLDARALPWQPASSPLHS